MHRFYYNWLMIYNNGELPSGWSTETLKIKHTSEPANPDIARSFFREGYIEAWSRGTINIGEYCVQAGLPEPVFEGKWGGLAVIFIKTSGAKPWEATGDKTEGNSKFQKDFRKFTGKFTGKFN